MEGEIELPLFPLRSVLIPGMRLPLHVFEARYRRLLSDCATTKRFGVTLIREGPEVGGTAVPHENGTVAEMNDLVRLANGSYQLEAVGRERFRIRHLHHDRAYLWCHAELLQEVDGDPQEARAADVQVRAFSAEYVRTLYTMLGETTGTPHLQLPDDTTPLSYAVAMLLQVTPQESQHLLEAPTAARRLAQEVELLRGELAILSRMALGRPTDARLGNARFSLN